MSNGPRSSIIQEYYNNHYSDFQDQCVNSYSYWCIASKLKATFLWNEKTRLCGWIYLFSISSYSGRIIMTKKLTGYWRHYHSRCRPPQPGVHTMSNERTLQISCNIFLAFKWILIMRSGHNTSHHTTAQLSVHVWNQELVWWPNKIDAQKQFPQEHDYKL